MPRAREKAAPGSCGPSDGGTAPSTQPQRPSSHQGSWWTVCKAQPLLRKDSQEEHSDGRGDKNRTGEDISVSEPLQEPQASSSPEKHKASRKSPICLSSFFQLFMFCFQPKVTGQTEGQKIQCEENRYVCSQTRTWAPSGAVREFQVTVINMRKALMEKLDSVQEQMGNKSQVGNSMNQKVKLKRERTL